MPNKKPIQTIEAQQNLANDPLSNSFVVVEENIEILGALLDASENITETVTVTRVSVAGSAYEFLLDTDTFNAEQTYEFRPGAQTVFAKRGDTITLACTNGNTTGTVSSQILYREDI